MASKIAGNTLSFAPVPIKIPAPKRSGWSSKSCWTMAPPRLKPQGINSAAPRCSKNSSRAATYPSTESLPAALLLPRPGKSIASVLAFSTRPSTCADQNCALPPEPWINTSVDWVAFKGHLPATNPMPLRCLFSICPPYKGSGFTVQSSRFSDLGISPTPCNRASIDKMPFKCQSCRILI